MTIVTRYFDVLPTEMLEEIASHCKDTDLGTLRMLDKVCHTAYTPLYQKALYPYTNDNHEYEGYNKLISKYTFIPIKKYQLTEANWYTAKFDHLNDNILSFSYRLYNKIYQATTNCNWNNEQLDQLKTFIENNSKSINYLIQYINIKDANIYADVLIKNNICPYKIYTSNINIDELLREISVEKIAQLAPCLKKLEIVDLPEEFLHSEDIKIQAFFNAIINSGAKPKFRISCSLKHLITKLTTEQIHLLVSNIRKIDDSDEVDWGGISCEKKDIIINIFIKANTKIKYSYNTSNLLENLSIQDIEDLSPCLANLKSICCSSFNKLQVAKVDKFIKVLVEAQVTLEEISNLHCLNNEQIQALIPCLKN